MRGAVSKQKKYEEIAESGSNPEVFYTVLNPITNGLPF